MYPYQIITDSCCDLPKQVLNKLELKVVPLSLTLRGKTLRDSTDADIRKVYDALRAGETATTAAVNPEGWAAALEPVLQSGRDALLIAFSSGLSTTYQSAQIAAQDLRARYPERKILVVDSLCASLGQGLLVYYACKKQEAGMELDALGIWLEENKLHLCHWFTVDDLMYLKRGGRVSAATALMGTMLKIKPILHVDDAGHLINVGKVRGRKASIEALAQKVEQLGLPGENDTMFICHGDCLEDARYLESILRERYGT